MATGRVRSGWSKGPPTNIFGASGNLHLHSWVEIHTHARSVAGPRGCESEAFDGVQQGPGGVHDQAASDSQVACKGVTGPGDAGGATELVMGGAATGCWGRLGGAASGGLTMCRDRAVAWLGDGHRARSRGTEKERGRVGGGWDWGALEPGLLRMTER